MAAQVARLEAEGRGLREDNERVYETLAAVHVAEVGHLAELASLRSVAEAAKNTARLVKAEVVAICDYVASWKMERLLTINRLVDDLAARAAGAALPQRAPDTTE